MAMSNSSSTPILRQWRIHRQPTIGRQFSICRQLLLPHTSGSLEIADEFATNDELGIGFNLGIDEDSELVSLSRVPCIQISNDIILMLTKLSNGDVESP